LATRRPPEWSKRTPRGPFKPLSVETTLPWKKPVPASNALTVLSLTSPINRESEPAESRLAGGFHSPAASL
jgi:hypothetical protein